MGLEHSFFRPGPVQGPGSGFWPGHRIVQVDFFFKKIKTTSFDQVLSGQPGRRVTPGFSFPCFFFNPARFQPLVGRAGFYNGLECKW
jgi:hypothetical protein